MNGVEKVVHGIVQRVVRETDPQATVTLTKGVTMRTLKAGTKYSTTVMLTAPSHAPARYTAVIAPTGAVKLTRKDKSR